MPTTDTKTRDRVASGGDREIRRPPHSTHREQVSPPSVPRLRWRNLTTEGAYYAVLVSSRFRPRSELHTHDFFEMMYVLAGSGIHLVNDQRLRLHPGDLVFVRSDDRHDIIARHGVDLQFVNVAFSEDIWSAFRAIARLSDDTWIGDSSSLPLSVAVPPEQREACERVFRRALFAFHQGASPLELCAFLSLSVAFLRQPDARDQEDESTLTPWLRSACWAMRDEANLRVGLVRFVELSGVSRAHLSRSLKLSHGLTPTQFVNRLRLERAALLLTTTTEEIGSIAADCGFGTLSYFYRLFEQRFGRSPRAYRLQAQRVIAP